MEHQLIDEFPAWRYRLVVVLAGNLVAWKPKTAILIAEVVSNYGPFRVRVFLDTPTLVLQRLAPRYDW